jgi:tricorn protease
MMNLGYYHHPAIYQGTIAFISEDDLWLCPLEGGKSIRLTTGLGAVSTPVFSPDGKSIAFAGSEEGQTEVYVIPSSGGPVKRLTYLGESVQVYAWTKEGIFFGSSALQPFTRLNYLYHVSPQGGTPKVIPMGPVSYISFKGTSQACVIQRHGYREYGYWKRYRGGTAGEIWIDEKGKRNFEKLIHLKSDFARPLWIKDRIYFSSDHEGIGNLYSCLPGGTDLKRHTHHETFYVRNQASDGQRIVYQAGGDLYGYDPSSNRSWKVEIDYSGQRQQRQRKFSNPRQYLESYSLHPQGQHLAVISRGKNFTFSNWEGAVLQLGEFDGIRYRHAQWLHDGKRIAVISDEGEEDTLEIYNASTTERFKKTSKIDLGRVLGLYPSPVNDQVIITNHRNELIHVDLKTWKHAILDKSIYSKINGVSWSPDGAWVAYSCSHTRITAVIKVVNIKTKKVTRVTKPVLKDINPVFDPEGKYIYFLSYRQFDPIWDSLHFELAFPRGIRPYLIPLQKDLPSPFLSPAKSLTQEEGTQDDKKKKEEKVKVKIDFDEIENRLLAFPVHDGLYMQIAAVKGKVFFLNWPLESALDEEDIEEDSEHGGVLEFYDLENHKKEVFAHHVTGFHISNDTKWMSYRSSSGRLRVLKTEEKPEDDSEDMPSGRKSGWIDLSRVRLSVNPLMEWHQMYKEAWRLQRDYFWTPDMSMIDWQKVYKRYLPLLDRISTRSELNDLIWEMQGELGTSHAYTFGGDVKRPPQWDVGSLAAEFVPHPKHDAFIIKNIAQGDFWMPSHSSPLKQPGANIKEGDLLWKINGRPLNAKIPPEALLVHLANQPVTLMVSDAAGKNKRTVLVKTLSSQQQARYRDWVESNRAYVHKKTKGKIGYLHIPDMSAKGFSEFHRYFLDESERDGLIVDVRFNGGGSVSPLILEKLARKRLGYDLTRWMGMVPYPEHSPAGPMVALINEYAGSDGDVFSHAFRLMKLGPLIGKRTWGGVIGIWPANPLVDGGITTQPEFSFWFKDLGWTVENYGVEPDIEIENKPQDYALEQDPQLDRGIEEVLKILRQQPPEKLDLTKVKRPNLALPESLPGLVALKKKK